MLKDIIPKDILKYAKKKIQTALIRSAAFLLAELLLLFIFHDSLKRNLNDTGLICVYVFLLIIPFFTSGFVKTLLDRSWEGRILAVHKKTTLGNTSVLTRGGAYKMFVIEATMHMENGKTDVKTIYEGPAEESQLWLYKEGTVVRHIKGCKFLQILNDDDEEKKVTCVVCGREEEKNEVSICKKCGHTLIR